jgi:glutathione S-transferase
MLLLGTSVSPFVRKVMMYAAEKGIALENRAVRPGSDDPDFKLASPFGKIPAFKDGDFTLADSTAIVHYLEAKVPNPPLIPLEPRARARAIWFDEMSDTVMFPSCTKIFFNRVLLPKLMQKPGDEARASEAETKELPRIFEYLESVIPGSGFLVGDSLTIADIAVVNQLVNLAYSNSHLDAGRYPKLAAYYARHSARPSITGLIAADKAMLGIQG